MFNTPEIGTVSEEDVRAAMAKLIEHAEPGGRIATAAQNIVDSLDDCEQLELFA